MKCPVCREAMIVLEWEQIEVDHCTNCKGVWLDSGELEMLLEDAREKDLLLASFQKRDDSHSKFKKCPICLCKMEQIACGNRPLRLDRCTHNHGVWLDAGELNEILEIATFKEHPKVPKLLQSIFTKEAAS